jgi:D-glycerate 3-kinase
MAGPDATAGPGGWIETLRKAEGLPETFSEDMQKHLPPLAKRTADLRAASGRPVVVGISGAQGSGKSTLALFLKEWFDRETGLRCVRLSLDDVYLGRKERQFLARQVHPLFATRGVPGTHDIPLALALLDSLTNTATAGQSLCLPVFDKAADDRMPASQWHSVVAPTDVVLFEGWCVGALPQESEELAEPVNALEAREDPNGSWRCHVNNCLKTDYAGLFARLDALVLLRIPAWGKVLEWRRLQETRLRDRLAADVTDVGVHSTQSDEQLKRFIMHYERLTKHMLLTLPSRADTVIDIDANHRLARRTDRGWRAAGRSRT